jgi:hypothetical protein
VKPVAPVDPVDPVDPVAPVGPAGPGTAGPGTGTATTAAGVTTVGLSHALNASATNTAENTIENFMRIPFNCLTKNRLPGRICGGLELQIESTPYPHAIPFAGVHSPASKQRGIADGRPDASANPEIFSFPSFPSYVRWRIEVAEMSGNSPAVLAFAFSPP